MSDASDGGGPAPRRPNGGLRLEAVTKNFVQAGRTLEVLRGVDLEVPSGRLIALVGPSGAGKSTLMHIAGLLERPDSGEVYADGRACSKLADRERTAVRRETIGFVYQYHHLLPEFSALENLIVPQMIAGRRRSRARSRAIELLDVVGLKERADHRPAQLSGGEQQRVAIARALSNAPKILLADEPTGNLDPHTAESVFRILVELVRGVGLAALVATHNLDLAGRMDRVLALDEGRITEPAATMGAAR
jgi:lipoprotein-releasing system ATP-binding protein